MQSLQERHASSTEFVGVDLVGTASTMYGHPDDVRFETSLQTAEAYRNAGVPYVIVDASSNPWVGAAHREREAIVLDVDEGNAGIATQRQQGVHYAYQAGANKIVGHEPEKPKIIDYRAPISALLTNIDVLVIGRTQKAENTLPPVQQRTERLAGWILTNTHKLPTDALCGPRGFIRAGAEELFRYPSHEDGMNNWIYLYHTPLAAKVGGLTIAGIQIDICYPEKIVADETDNPVFDAKRYSQFSLQLNYMLRRTDIRAEGLVIARRVLDLLSSLPENPSNEVYEQYFKLLEASVAEFGYEPAERKV